MADDKAEVVFRELGIAIASWQMVKGALTDVFVTAMQPKDHRVTVAAFYAVFNPNAKINMTEKAVGALRSKKKNELEQIKKTWGGYSDRITKHAKRRNYIVHGEIYTLVQQPPKKSETIVLSPIGTHDDVFYRMNPDIAKMHKVRPPKGAPSFLR